MGEWGIERFIEETNSAQTEEDVSTLFANVLQEFGYDRFCYSLITDHPSLGLRAQHGLVQNYPSDWMQHYACHHYEKIDPVPLYGVSMSRPFTWDSLLDAWRLSREQTRVMNEAKEAKLLDGIAIPIFGYNSELAGIGMASSSGGVRPDANLLSKLRALSSQFHLAYTELKRNNTHHDKEKIQLTGREKEILLWAAAGKSDSVIADILGVTHATIRFHMSNIFKKLNANERTLATVKAIRHGLILPSCVG